MGQIAKAPRQNRTITVDFQDQSTYFQLISNGKTFVEFVVAYPMAADIVPRLLSVRLRRVTQPVIRFRTGFSTSR
jgi:hypothetical protein